MEEQIMPCCKCGQLPHIKCEPGDLWYSICNCGKWNKYEFLATTRRGTIRNWNEFNRCMKQTGHPRGIK